jgi:hypothetical protein
MIVLLSLPKGDVLKVWENPNLVNPSSFDQFKKYIPGDNK